VNAFFGNPVANPAICIGMFPVPFYTYGKKTYLGNTFLRIL